MEVAVAATDGKKFQKDAVYKYMTKCELAKGKTKRLQLSIL